MWLLKVVGWSDMFWIFDILSKYIYVWRVTEYIMSLNDKGHKATFCGEKAIRPESKEEQEYLKCLIGTYSAKKELRTKN